MEALGISLPLLVSQLVNFGLLMLILYLLLYKPILRMLHQRQERIARAMADADVARENASKSQQEYDRRVVEAQRKAQEIVAQATQQGEDQRTQIIAEAQQQAEEIRQKAHAEAARESERMLADLHRQIASLSMLATERVLGKSVATDESLQRRLIDQFLAELNTGDSGDQTVAGASPAVRDAV